MDFQKYLNADLILLEPVSRTKEDLLSEFARILAPFIHTDHHKLYKKLCQREELGTTGIGHGIAIPHCKTPDYDTITIMIARSQRGIDFNSMDQKPVHLFFVIVAGSKCQGPYFRVLSHLSRTLQEQEIYNRMIQAETPTEIYEILMKS